MYVRQREKPQYSGEKKITYYPYSLRDGSQNLRVRRIDIPGKEKDIKPEHLDTSTGEWKTGFGPYNRSDIRIYRYEETRKAKEAGLPIVVCEGEGKVDALIEKGLAACCNIGGSKKWRKTDTMDLAGAKEIYIAPDCDKPGIEHAKLLLKEFPQAKFLLPFKDSPRWENIPEKHGIDIKNYLDDYPSLTGDEIIENLSIEASEVPFLDRLEFPKFNDTPKKQAYDDYPREIAKVYTQKALDELFAGHWIAIAGELYKWCGTHYEIQAEECERRRIATWLNNYAESTPQGLKHNRASKKAISEIFGWAIDNFSIPPDKANPPGLNCQNGVVEIRWEDKKAVWELSPHNPERYYIYCSDIEFNPEADKADCDKLLSCLPAPQRKIFLQTIAAALDLPTIRKHRGRMVRLLIAYGSGSNGKDTLREAIEIIFGRGMTAASLSDFQAYDQGRKFPLAKLDGALINWPSENSQFATLDNIQSIKQFATGDPLWIEKKNKDEYRYNPRAIGIFSCNDLPIIRGANEAIRSRWAFLKFPYTFKQGANAALGEIEADPRFKYDPDFLKSKVAPALLNEVLAALETLLEEGINYEPCAEALEEAQEEGNHLRQFSKDVGLIEMPGQKVYISDLWEKLKAWYLATGTAEKEEGRERLLWNDFPNKYDKPIKAPNQIRARFGELFKCSYGKEKIDKERENQAFLGGICFAPEIPESLLDKEGKPRKPVGSQLENLESLLGKGKEAKEAKEANLGEVIQFLSENFSEEERAEICKALCQRESLTPQEIQPTPEPVPQPEADLSEDHVAGMAENVRIALSEGNWELIAAIMDVAASLKKAVWESLSDAERQRIRSLRMAFEEKQTTTPEPTPAPEPEPTPEPIPQREPDLPPADRVGDRVRCWKTYRYGTITYIYEDKGKAMVEFDVEEKGGEKKSEVYDIKKLELKRRKPQFEKIKSNDSKIYKTGPIHKLAVWQPGQILLTKSGKKVGRVVKGCSGGVVVRNLEGKEEKMLFSAEIELMQYQRAWVLGDGWEDGFMITDIPGKAGTYSASLRKLGTWYCDIHDTEMFLKTSFVGKAPNIYGYDFAKDWMRACIETFLKRE